MNVGRRLFLLAIVMALVAAACSSADSGGGSVSLDATDQKLADAIARTIQDDTDPSGAFGSEAATCFGNSIVAEIGTSRLAELGLDLDAVEAGTSPSDVELSDGDIDAMVSVMTKCIDFRSVFVQEFKDSGISDEGVTCIADGLDDNFIESMARGGLTNDSFEDDPAIADKMLSLVMGCLSVDDLQKLGSS